MMNRLRNLDFILIITPILLAAFGVVMIYSASMVSAVVEGLSSTYYFKRQLQWYILSLILFTFCTIFPYRHYQKMIKLIVLGSIALLFSVLLFGKTAHNATRSIVLFNAINIQPSEFVKLGLILYLASVYSKKQGYIDDFARGVLPPLIITSFILGLIIKQPDIGTASIILLIAFTVVISSGIRLQHILSLVSVGVVFLLVITPRLVTEGRISRFVGAYQPFAIPDNDGYHLIQSYLAIGMGGIKGEGLGQSIQKLGYLWGAHTDFIMSVIAEELGFFGVLIVISLLAVIVLRGMYIARVCNDSFGSLIAIGVSSMIGVQALINLGAISGLLPITGVPLPFISYGGSSLLVLMIAMGILNNIAMTSKMKRLEASSHQKDDENREYNFQLGGKTWHN